MIVVGDVDERDGGVKCDKLWLNGGHVVLYSTRHLL